MPNLQDAFRLHGYTDRILTERQLADVIGGSAARRYGIVNRALKNRSLLRIKRGLYALPVYLRSAPLHPFVVAQALLPGSYVSFESALSFHGWIPEAVRQTASVTPGRKSIEHVTETFGTFTFLPLALQPYQFLVGVERQRLNDATALIASPLRALMDIVAYRKIKWQGMSWITEGLRVDIEQMSGLDPQTLEQLCYVYKHTAAKEFADRLYDACIPSTGRRDNDRHHSAKTEPVQCGQRS